MNKFEFLEKAMLLAVGLGTEDLPTVLARAEEAYTLLNPPPLPKPSRSVVSQISDEEKVLGVLRDGPVSAIERDVAPVRVRDVLLQAMRAKYGTAIATVRLHNALQRLEMGGVIRFSPDRQRIELA